MSSAHLGRLWRRHHRTVWILHSIWALATGVVVLWLAREHYGFVPWVVIFLGLTWASTLFFGRRPAGGAGEAPGTGFGRGLASYLTRIVYQETLFFLLPFYAYSTVFASWNVFFVVGLGALAVLTCLDLVFDRWLRHSPVFGLVFFASVAFSALNLLLPLLFSLAPAVATPLAAVVAIVSAAPLALLGSARGLHTWLRLAAAGVVILAVAIWLRPLVPPVPLRLQQLTFAADLDRDTLEPTAAFGRDAAADALGGKLVVIASVFAPSNVPSRVAIDWYRDGTAVRSSREVTITAHAGGFRLWDALNAEGALAPGRYRIVLRTADGRVFGAGAVRLH